MRLAIVALTLSLVGCVDNTIISEGSRVGVVTKLSHKALCDTGHWGWEGELTMQGGTTAGGQGMNDAGQSQVNAWAFSVASESSLPGVVESLQSALTSGHRVKLSYRQVGSHDPCQSGSDYQIVAAQDMEIPR